jgi:ArsR family transcriptional regulator, arsenate/arsenite/antimonite-responsive transcriptional repressor
MMVITPDELFSLLSDETRLRCLILLQKEGELCVCEISQIIGSIQPKISRHLALMRKSGLVSDERRGQWVYYSLNPSLQDWAKQIMISISKNLMKKDPYCSDIKKLSSLKKENICKISR